MRVEVDQSGKIGDTRVPTVLAFSNEESYAILIPAKVKRECVQRLREQGRTGKTFYMRLFAIGLFFLLKDYAFEADQIAVDVEYPGRNAEVKLYLLNILWQADVRIDTEEIHFEHIGKSSRAHKKALAVYTKEQVPDKVIKLDEILALVQKISDRDVS